MEQSKLKCPVIKDATCDNCPVKTYPTPTDIIDIKDVPEEAVLPHLIYSCIIEEIKAGHCTIQEKHIKTLEGNND